MNTKASNWFKTNEHFLQVCSDALLLAHGESNEEFAAQMMIRARQHGIELYLSEKQVKWLCKLADCVVPLPENKHA